VRINTLAYQATDEIPKSIRPRPSIIPRRCDTDANLLRPITHPDNVPFAGRVAAWGAIVDDLRIWDYAVTYTPYFGLPLPTAHTYPVDPDHPDQKFEVWARIKFNGPGFPHGKPEEENAISVERVVLVRQQTCPLFLTPS
jgi:hypothetical protein